MNMPTPTSNPSVPSAPVPGAPALEAGALEALANSFFRALPGAALPAAAFPGRSIGHPLSPAGASPALADSSAPPPAASVSPTLPQIPLESPPRTGTGPAGIAQGVPEAYAASLPAVGPRSGLFRSPYYFLEPTEAPGGPDPFPEPHFSFLDGNVRIRDSRPPIPGMSHASLFDVQAIRRDFPILAERVNGKPLIWFDNAATTQKPRSVIERISHFYAHENSNIHRAAHELAARSTDAYEGARKKVAEFLGAKGPEEIIFVRGTTEAINLVARTYGRQEIGEGDEIIVSHLEHHANIVPWQQLAEFKKAKIRVIPVDEDGQIRLDEYARLLGPRTRIVAIAQVSNALGTVTPVAEIIAMAHGAGAKVLVDGAQSVSHMRVNVQALDADFFVFSGHKVFAPTGIGVVYGKKALLDGMPPWQGGGNMIADVTFEQTVYQAAPARFEAGTGSIADAVGLGAALDYVQQVGLDRIGQYEHALLEYATERLRPIPGVRLVGTAREKASVLSFVLEGFKTEEVGAALNREGIAVRSGHHCAQPILRRFGLESTVRPSLAFYNTCEEVDVFISVIRGLVRRRG